MRFISVKAHEIPPRLLLQKESWDVEEFYRIAISVPDMWMAFEIEMGSQRVGAVLYSESKLYRKILVDTLIIDRDFRDAPLMREVFRAVRLYGLHLAKTHGYDAIESSTEWSLDAYKKIIPDFRGEFVESTVREPVLEA